MAENEIEVKAAELKAELDIIRAEHKQAKEDWATSDKQIKQINAELEAKVAKIALVATDTEVKKMQEDVVKLNEGINELNKKMAEDKMETKGTFEDALSAVYNGEEFKAQLAEVLDGKRAKTQTFQIEAKLDPVSVITSGATNPVSRTYGNMAISGGLFEPNKFIAAMNVITIPADRNRVMYFDGQYFDNADYVAELTEITTGDGATIEEKYREIAKLAAKLLFSTEAATEMSYFVDWAKGKGVESVLAKLDQEIYSGIGADGGAYTKKIYGLKTQGSTTFNATTADMAVSVQDANLADLILAASSQVKIQSKGYFVPDKCFLYPSAVAKLRTLKNKFSDYINILVDGSLLVHGIKIEESAKVGADEMLLVTSKTLQLHQKASMETEIERKASVDGYCMYLRWKGQVVVTTTDKLGNIYVANTTTAIAAISAGSTIFNVFETNNGITTTTTSTTTTTTTTAG